MRHRCFGNRLSASRVQQAGRHVGDKVSRTSRCDQVTRKTGYPPEAHLILSAFRLSPHPQSEGYRRELASFYVAPVMSVRTGSSPLLTRPRVGPGPTWPSRTFLIKPSVAAAGAPASTPARAAKYHHDECCRSTLAMRCAACPKVSLWGPIPQYPAFFGAFG